MTKKSEPSEVAGKDRRDGQYSHTNECFASGLTRLDRADAGTEIHFPRERRDVHAELRVTPEQVARVVKNPPANVGDVRDVGSVLGLGSSPGEGMAARSSILA
ncbi:unnamed protein product [Rangifer tarandus platyrhynchus]|uniref:Uncharacterized protein n=1 Tax=Rangifer tarandus platyrhynchus TaxID=3082113 RepID=A0AC59ZEU0_RANTA